MLKTLFKRKAPKQQEAKTEPVLPSLDERPLFDKPALKTLNFQVEGMQLQNEKQLPIQAALHENLQHYMEQNNTNNTIHQLQFTSAQVIFFPDKENREDPNATKVYLDFTFNQLHIGYVPSNVGAQLIDIINNKKARSFKGTFLEIQNEPSEQPIIHFQIEIQHI